MRRRDHLLASDIGHHRLEAEVKVVDRSKSLLSGRTLRTPTFGSTNPYVLPRKSYTPLKVSEERIREVARVMA